MKNLILSLTMMVSLSLSAQHKKILFVLSAADTLHLNDGQYKRQTGVFLNEFYLAYQSVTANGYTVDFATPNGKVSTIDAESLNDDYWKGHLQLKMKL